MTWTARSGREYRLCLLDTNALSVLVNRPKEVGRGFLEKFPPDSWVPCWTLYNLIELRQASHAYQRWLDFFSVYPSFVLKRWETLVCGEVANYESGANVSPLLSGFSSNRTPSKSSLREFINHLFSDPELRKIEKRWVLESEAILEEWRKSRGNFIASRTGPNANDAEKYVESGAFDYLCFNHGDWISPYAKRGIAPDPGRFPSLSAMLYSQYYRLHDPRREMAPSDVTDIRIMAAAPYMEAIVTENFQAEVLKKIRGYISRLRDTAVYRISDLRHQGTG